jgi:hypothetical protein
MRVAASVCLSRRNSTLTRATLVSKYLRLAMRTSASAFAGISGMRISNEYSQCAAMRFSLVLFCFLRSCPLLPTRTYILFLIILLSLDPPSSTQVPRMCACDGSPGRRAFAVSDRDRNRTARRHTRFVATLAASHAGYVVRTRQFYEGGRVILLEILVLGVYSV